MQFSAKDLEILNARSQFQRAFYGSDALRPTEFLKSPNRFGGPSSAVPTTPSSAVPIKTNVLDAATRFEQGFTAPRSVPGVAAAPLPSNAASSPLREALASAVRLPSIPPNSIPNGIAANAGRIAPIARGAAASLSTPLAGAAGLLYGPAKSVRDAALEAEKNALNAIAPGAGDALKQGLNAFDPIFGGQIPPWLNPLNQHREPINPQKPNQTVTFPSGVRIHYYSPNNGAYTENDVLSFSIIPSPPPAAYPFYLSLTYTDGRVQALGPNIDPSTLEIRAIPGQPLPPLPTSPLQTSRPPDTSGFQPDYVPVGGIQAFPTPTGASAPSALPSTEVPGRYPTTPSTPGLPAPAPNRPKEENKPSVPLIPPLPFIPLLPAKAPSPISNLDGYKSLTDPKQSPVPNVGNGMDGAKPPAPPISPAAPRCRDRCGQKAQDSLDSIQDKLQKGIPFLNAAGQAIDLSLLNTINTKLGDQLPGGIGGKLSRLGEWLHLDRVMNALTLITTLHNASMLSGSLASTLGSLTSQALAVIGIKDDNGSPLNINEIISKEADEFMKSLLGNEIWSGTKENWNKANRIISTASQIVWTIRSMADATRDVMEWTAENTGKIGNALKRFRVVGEHAYSWMPERVNVQNRWTQKVNQFTENISNIDNTASSLASVVGSVQSIEDEFGQLKEQRENFDKALKEATPKARVDNDATKQKAALTTTASASPVLQTSDRDKGEPTP